MTAWRFLFISLALHVLVWLFLLQSAHEREVVQSQRVEITVVENHSKIQPLPFVKTPALTPDKLVPPKNPKYSSTINQSVKKEMIAERTGRTRNGNGKPKTQSQEKNAKDSGQKSAPKELDPNGKKERFSRFEPGPLDNAHVMTNSGYSQSDNYLPDLNKGPINALNSERFVYSSFFSRIDEHISPLWISNIETAHQRLSGAVLKRLADKDWITILEILLDDKGHYLDTIVVQSSGIPEFDQAAIQAFQSTKYFPNPPKEMVQDDGKIHLKYGFVVEENSAGSPFRAWR